jgi:hypothetical protein
MHSKDTPSPHPGFGHQEQPNKGKHDDHGENDERGRDKPWLRGGMTTSQIFAMGLEIFTQHAVQLIKAVLAVAKSVDAVNETLKDRFPVDRRRVAWRLATPEEEKR